MRTRDDKAELNKQVWIIKTHQDKYGHDAERLAQWHLLRETRRIAYLLGITNGNKRKLQLWKEIDAQVRSMPMPMMRES